jgi:hypothetical protein
VRFFVICKSSIAGWILPFAVPGTRRNAVLTGRGIFPIEMPELPSELVLLTLVDESSRPRTLIEPNLDWRDRRTPRCTVHRVPAVLSVTLAGIDFT